MRRLILVAVSAALISTFSLPLASASAASTYCSPSGDYCYAAKKRGGVVRIMLDTFSFRGRVKVCVQTPVGDVDCRRFKLRSRGDGLYGFSIRWSRHFPTAGRGRYNVDFYWAGIRIGSGVTFRVR